MWPNLQFPADLGTFTGEILSGRLYMRQFLHILTTRKTKKANLYGNKWLSYLCEIVILCPFLPKPLLPWKSLVPRRDCCTRYSFLKNMLVGLYTRHFSINFLRKVVKQKKVIFLAFKIVLTIFLLSSVICSSKWIKYVKAKYLNYFIP